MNKTIFKSYDIRGIYGREFDAGDVSTIARAFLQVIARRANKNENDLRIIIAKDIRNSSDDIAERFIDQCLQYGVVVEDAGQIPITALYYMTGQGRYDGGVMITASHNPPEYGGLKLVDHQVRLLSGSRIILPAMEEPMDLQRDQGKLIKIDIWAEYLHHVFQHVEAKKVKPLKLVVDAGNGIAGQTIPKIFEHLPQIQLVPMFFEPDGNFPNRPPNPLEPGAIDQISKKVLETKADMGAVFDADSDRVFLVDEKGGLVTGDMTLLLLAKAVLKRHKNAGIVYNLICSKAVPELVIKWGGRAIRSEVGVMNLSRHLLEQDGIIGGEVSSHFVFKSNYGMDGSYNALVMALQVLSEDGRSLSEIIDEYRLYFRAPELNIKVEDTVGAITKVRSRYFANIRDEMDGITVEFPDWWFNVRASNTEPLLRITVETNTEAEASKKQEEILKVINN